MAGPTASILISDKLSDEQRLSVRSAILEMSNHVDGNSFWIQERPFIVGFGPEYDGEMEEYATSSLSSMTGWMPKDSVRFAAMCNQPIDHRLLGGLCLRVAKLLGGVVNFGAELDLETKRWEGKLFVLHDQSVSGGECECHIGTAAFLEWWLKQPNFHMIK